MKKILYLLDDPGKDKHVHKYVLDGLASAGFTPTIGYFFGNPEHSVMANEKIRAFGLGLSKDQFKGINPRAVYRLRKHIQQGGYHIVHCQRHRALVHAGIAAAGLKTGLIYTVRATNVLRNANRRLALRLIHEKIRKIICVSQAVEDYVKKSLPFLPDELFGVIHNGVDLDKFSISCTQKEARGFLGIPQEGFYFGILARLKKAKCHDILLKAFSRVVKRFPDTRLAVVGDGPLEGYLKGLSADLGISKKVFFTGKVQYHEVPLALRAFDCFVHPSFREGLGVAVLEAMASFLPVIVSSADGLRDIFQHLDDSGGKYAVGAMVRPKDADHLAQEMTEFRKLPGKTLKDIGKRGRVHVEKYFSKELMVEKTLAVYRSVLKMQE